MKKELSVIPNELSKEVPEFDIEDIKLLAPLKPGEVTSMGGIYKQLIAMRAKDSEKDVYFLGEDHIEILLSCVDQKISENRSRGHYLALWGTALRNKTDYYRMIWSIEYNWENDLWLKCAFRTVLGEDDISKWIGDVHYGMLIPYVVK